jgi:hypothetical protein
LNNNTINNNININTVNISNINTPTVPQHQNNNNFVNIQKKPQQQVNTYSKTTTSNEDIQPIITNSKFIKAFIVFYSIYSPLLSLLKRWLVFYRLAIKCNRANKRVNALSN